MILNDPSLLGAAVMQMPGRAQVGQRLGVPSGGDRNRELAQMLMKQSQQTQIQHPFQGLAMLAEAYQARKLNEKADAEDEARNKALGELLTAAQGGDQQALATLANADPERAKIAAMLRGPEPGPSKTREIERGSEKVTEEFDPTTKKWVEIARAPRWNPTPAPATTVNLNEGKVLTKAHETAITRYYDQLDEAKKAALTSRKVAESAARVLALNNDAVAGSAAPAQIQFFGFLSSLGVKVPQEVANGASISAEQAEQFIAQMQAAGGARGLTEKETQEMKAGLTQVGASREARTKVANIIIGAAKRNEGRYKKLKQHERAILADPSAVADVDEDLFDQPIESGALDDVRAYLDQYAPVKK